MVATLPGRRAVLLTRALLGAAWVAPVAGVVVVALGPHRQDGAVQAALLPVLVTFFGLLVAAVLVCAHARPGRRPAMLVLAGGVLAWAGGSAMLNAADTGAVQPFPTPGEVLFLLAYLGFAAFLLLDVPRRTDRATAVWLDTTVVCGGAAALASALVLTPLTGSMDTGGLAQLLSVLYPLLDLVLLTVVAAQLVLGERAAGLRTTLLLLAFAGLAAADASLLLADGVGYSGDLALSVAWGGAFAVLVTAATVPRRQGEAGAGSQATGTLAAASLVALVVLVVRPVGQDGWYVTVPAVVTLVAAGFRMSLALQEARGRAAAVLLSRTDELTGLANRRALLTEAADRLATDSPMGLVLLDLDGFKEINDSLGHAAGDTVLETVGQRLRAELGPDAVPARLGGDEFAWLVTHDDPLTLLEQARAVSAALTVTQRVDDLDVTVRSSMGVTVRIPTDREAGDLLRRADVALYDAKSARGGVLLYDSSRDDFSRQRLRMAAELRRGVAEGQLVVHYQPQVDAHRRHVVGMEALVRWEHPEQGLLLPAAFMGPARRSGLMPALSEVVLRQVVLDVVAWRAQGLTFRVAMNAAPPELLGGTLLPSLYAALADTFLPPSALTVEVTEDSFLTEPERAREVLAELRAHGVEIAIDDYGTGFSSLAYLRDLPVQELKMDRSFVSTVLADPRSRVIVESTTQMAHAMGLRLVAEGVEDELTARALTAMGVDLLQGYHVARPMPGPDVAGWVRARAVPRQAEARGAGGLGGLRGLPSVPGRP